MKQQILVIGGGTTFDSHESYISFLKSKEINLKRLQSHREWKDALAEELGENLEVFVPKMPNITNARYNEWKIWFERILSFLNNNLILIGHSLGGIFLAKYLSENKISKKIKATILVAAPFSEKDLGESLGSFKLPSSLSNFTQHGGSIFLFYSKDDPVVPFEHMNKFHQALPNSQKVVFNDRGHFKTETFPELVDLIKSFRIIERTFRARSRG